MGLFEHSKPIPEPQIPSQWVTGMSSRPYWAGRAAGSRAWGGLNHLLALQPWGGRCPF